MDDYQALTKCFTPEIYSQIKYSATSTNTLSSRGSSLQSQPSPISGPMDLSSTRPLSVPIPPQCTPLYADILPTIYSYNYFR